MSYRPYAEFFAFLAATMLSAGVARAACDFTVTPTGTGNADLQTAIDKAVRGQTICLKQGQTYTPKGGNTSFVLKAQKTGTGYITIMTENIDALAPPNKRVTTTANLAKIVPVSTYPGIVTAEFDVPPGVRPWYAHPELTPQYYRLVGLEVRPPAGVYTNGLVKLGNNTDRQSLVFHVPHHIELDRMYIHGHGDSDAAGKRGIEVHSMQTVIKNSYLSGFGKVAQETHAIIGVNGVKDLLIYNNYIEAAGINILFGGDVPRLGDNDTLDPTDKLIPENIVILHNHFKKLVSWKKTSGGWDVKNHLETKLARNVIIEGNVFENNWRQGQQEQSGSAIVFKAIAGRDNPQTKVNEACTVPNAVTENVLVQYNYVRNTGAGFEIISRDYQCKDDKGAMLGRVKHVRIENNVIDGLNSVEWPGRGTVLALYTGPDYLTVNHNTIIQPGGAETEAVHFETTPKGKGFKFTNNVLHHGLYGVASGNPPTTAAIGNTALKNWTDWVADKRTSSAFRKNALVGGSTYQQKYLGNCSSQYPDANDKCYPGTWQEVGFYSYATGDYRLLPNGKFSGKGEHPFTRKPDGKDLGADVAGVNSKTNGVANSGAVAPTPIADTQAFVNGMPQWINSKLHQIVGGGHVSVSTSIKLAQKKGLTFSKAQAVGYGCPANSVGMQQIFAVIENAGADPISNILFKITQLSSGNRLVVHPETGPIVLKIGDVYGLPYHDVTGYSAWTGAYDDAELTTGENVNVVFNVCLASMSQYMFNVDALAQK
ncbi:MAG: hypothetical protein KIT09_18160 [Bryobacteraceae bacterium]|nr:hypothetical protein [Bryobacteraceae bacterium]